MSRNAVLPSAIGWSFASTSQVNGEASSLLSNPFSTENSTHNSGNGRAGLTSPNGSSSMKRRVSDAMDDSDSYDGQRQSESDQQQAQQQQQTQQQTEHQTQQRSPQHSLHGPKVHSPSSSGRYRNTSRVAKRARVQQHGIYEHQNGSPVKKSPLKLVRVLESLDRKGLQEILEGLCESHGPELENEVTLMAPKVTVAVALDNLKNRLQAIWDNFPYKGNQNGDYAYYRVQPFLDEFFSAFVDYTVNFLPPNEAHVSNSLSFLDGATEFLLKIPDWENPIHNHSKVGMLDELSSAWLITLKEASKRSNGLGLYFHSGWDQKLEKHNRNSNGRLGGALEYLRQELSWANAAGVSQITPGQPSLNTSPWVGQS